MKHKKTLGPAQICPECERLRGERDEARLIANNERAVSNVGVMTTKRMGARIDELQAELDEARRKIAEVLQLQGETHPGWNDEYLRRDDVARILCREQCGTTKSSMYEHEDRMECVECVRKEAECERLREREAERKAVIDDALCSRIEGLESERDTLQRELEEARLEIERLKKPNESICPRCERRTIESAAKGIYCRAAGCGFSKSHPDKPRK